ncbi:hypothetical protein AB1A81_05630 [Bdellovibrio bacteriovorus]|uniref:Bdellovibrio beta-sandwich domain-containing protein n=1 Tax=Bdellovibrio bacteriovorus (strain ATCC 15356 / DSM 50701 / NCIMB 9529 / HD100) TaxID=264462 RepID=Q6MNL4_BDEBA|nr:hypothetical protein [Bdellovibrio bacteriovorus]AHZ86451.1 hypothetical protein EP01_16135 [Bdellovibrio bacteriovorus]BEV67693.1 hypothetical protein Bb109J_c1113 [Bdellovibrio bacteriovorus]CAE79137.1 hypothetical protein predicted by Glimmer/Critica [Bdellovibrio bacteriovorus HD100]
MGKWLILILTIFALSTGVANDGLPVPLPDDPYPGEPYPVPPPAPPKDVPYSLGGGETGRFGTRTFDFFPRYDLNRIKRIRLVGLRNNLEIVEVHIQYADSSAERREYRLEGELKSSGVREAALDGRPIYRISVKASPSYFWKKPGGFRVDVIAVK